MASSLRLVFMGTPAYAVPSLDALLDSAHEIACVYAQPARPRGRGQKPQASPVAARAEAADVPLRTPRSLKDTAEQDAFGALDADLAVTIAYGLILPPAIVHGPRLGCINAHASLLPRWRGAAPIQRAIMAGDHETGVSIMRIDEGLDTGPVLLVERLPIGPDTTAGSLHDEMAALSSRLLIEAVDGLAAGRLEAMPQPEGGTTYAKKIDKAEAALDWRRPAPELDCQIRGLMPSPGAWFAWDDTRIKVLAAAPTEASSDAPPGTVLDDALTIACGGGTALSLVTLQRAGKGPMAVDAFLRGYALPAGTRLACPATS